MFKSHGPVKHYLLATLKCLEIITEEINWFYIPLLKKKLSSSFWESHFFWIKQEAGNNLQTYLPGIEFGQIIPSNKWTEILSS